MSISLIQTITERGAWNDLDTSNGFPWTGTGERWFPPSDVVAIDCSQVYRACILTSRGAETRRSRLDPVRGFVPDEYWHTSPFRTASYAEQLLNDFDNGPERFNPPALVPFQSTWLEWGSHGDSPHKVGTLVSNDDDGSILAWTFMSFPHIADPFFMAACRFGPDCRAFGSSISMYPASRRWASMLPDHAMRQWGQFSDEAIGGLFMLDGHLFDAIRLALKLPNSRLAELAETQPRKVGKKQKRLRPNQRITWREIVMVGFTPTLNRRNASRGGQRFMAEHAVRANRALYTEDAPLFGNPKLVGWFIRPPHKRGNRKNGVVIQTRRIGVS